MMHTLWMNFFIQTTFPNTVYHHGLLIICSMLFVIVCYSKFFSGGSARVYRGKYQDMEVKI